MSNTETVDLDDHPIAEESDATASVPVIDISPLTSPLSGGSLARAAHAVAARVAAACSDWGFFQIVNHGIPQALIADVRRQMQLFFSLPRSVKEKILRTRENPWGYYNNELTKNRRDRKEVFDFGREGRDDIYGADNRWPDALPEFRATMESYLAASERLSLTLLESFCIGLDLPSDFLSADFAGGHTGFVRLNYYPVEDPLAGSSVAHLPSADLGVHHHTDAGALTILLQDDVAGLQVYHDGVWHGVPPIAGALVVNTGDMMQIWSNDLYRAAVHRVLAMDREDRFSIPFFFNPAAGTVVRPLPSTVSEARPARYRPVDWAGFRGRRTDGDYADYGPEVQISQYRIGA